MYIHPIIQLISLSDLFTNFLKIFQVLFILFYFPQIFRIIQILLNNSTLHNLYPFPSISLSIKFFFFSDFPKNVHFPDEKKTS